MVDSIPEVFGRRLPNTNIVPTRNSKILCRRNAWEMNYLNRPRFRIGGNDGCPVSKRLSTAAAQDGTDIVPSGNRIEPRVGFRRQYPAIGED